MKLFRSSPLNSELVYSLMGVRGRLLQVKRWSSWISSRRRFLSSSRESLSYFKPALRLPARVS